MAQIQRQFSFRRPLPNLFKFELNAVYKAITINKCILGLRITYKHGKKEYHLEMSQGASYCFIYTCATSPL